MQASTFAQRESTWAQAIVQAFVLDLRAKYDNPIRYYSSAVFNFWRQMQSSTFQLYQNLGNEGKFYETIGSAMSALQWKQ